MQKAMVSLILVGLTALASVGGANAQRGGHGSYNSNNGVRAYSPYYGGYGSGYSPYYGGNGYGFAPNYGGYGYGNAANYRGYDYAPYYQNYGYDNAPGSYYYSEPATRQSFYYGPATAPQYATMTIVVPTADAQVWFGDTATEQRGTVRVFQSPSLEPGKNFVYTIKARWMEQSQAVEKERRVNVQAGQRVTVDFQDALRPSNGSPSR